MLIELSVANFRSFRDRVTLSLEAESRISERDKSVDERNVAHTPDGDLLRVVGIYGANASGKSNLVTALSTLRKLVLNSAREGQKGDSLPAAPFRLDRENLAAPSELEAVFTQDGMQIRYGAAFTRKRVEREWLFVRPPGADVEERWFERTGNAFETGGAWVRDTGIEEKTRAEALHISVAAAWNHAQAQRLLGWFQELYVLDAGRGTFIPSQTIELLRDDEHRETICTLMRRLDFGIDDLQVVTPHKSTSEFHAIITESLKKAMPDVFSAMPVDPLPRLVAIRQGILFDLENDESAGTNKAVVLAGPIIKALIKGGILIIDEFDARLHTLLAKQLVELFQDPATNPHDAQLVFTSHDTNLLTRTLLRRDQLWFVEKSHKTHASDLYSLAEFRFEDGKAIRNDARYEVDYLQGRYGAIPFFGNLKALLGDALTKKD
jgi:energy-coupling factor transporter ATP-binding protein EcfA2